METLHCFCAESVVAGGDADVTAMLFWVQIVFLQVLLKFKQKIYVR